MKLFKLLTVALFVSIFTLGDVRAANSGAAEGITTEVSAKDLEPLKSWIYNSKQDLDRGLQDIKRQPTKYQEALLRGLVDQVMARADKRANEFLMRNVLYRAQDVHNMLLKVPSDPKRNGFARRFLVRSIEWATQLAGTDEELLKQMDVQAFTKGTERAALGLQWARMMTEMSFSLPTNSAHLDVLKMAMAYLYNDIVQDDKYSRHLAPIASQFLLKFDQLKNVSPITPLQKLELIKDIRQMLMDETESGLKLLENKVSPRATVPTSNKLPFNIQLKNPNAKFRDPKVGEIWVLVNTDEFYFVQIADIVNGKYKVKYLNKDLRDKYGSGWTTESNEFAMTDGCHMGICVGDFVIRIQDNIGAYVIGIFESGHYALFYPKKVPKGAPLNSSHDYSVGGYWLREDIVKAID